ncbi:MAG: TonB-dependent receptor plug domain-containing protein [Bacteroidales bacterium]|nr:TonB-dependent receptor plug domain-containing protein [Bacteroidales bacterium]MDD3859314.1 TonB-dependent receptor plug domain-containing protein [Bacteroidales bacterium]
MKRLSLFISVLVLFSGLSAQNITISGYIVCDGTRDRIPDTEVIETNSGIGTTSNEYGFYKLKIPSGDSAIISVSHVAYKAVKYVISAHKNLHLDIVLTPGYILKEVTIRDTSRTIIERRLEAGTIYLPISQINKINSVSGEPDILRVLQLTPGVGSGNEGSAGIYVRGGGSEQNLYLIDGVALYGVNHLGRFMSVFDAESVESVELIKGGFPANYGNRLSSVLDVKLKEGNKEMLRGNFTLGLINTKISLQGPISSGKTAYMFSARRFMYDLILYPASTAFLDDQIAGYTFYDLNMKLNHYMNDKNSLSFVSYHGNDKLNILTYNTNSSGGTNRIGLGWGNKMLSLGWNHLYGDRIKSQVNLSFVNYSSSNMSASLSNIEDVYSKGKYKSKSGISDLMLKADFDYRIWKKSFIKAGISSTLYTCKPFSYSYFSSINDSIIADSYLNAETINTVGNSIYLLGELYAGKYLSANTGFRMTGYFTGKKVYWEPEPRVLLMLRIPKVFTVKAGYSVMYQNIIGITGSDTDISIETWLNSTELVPPSRSVQYDVGLARSFNEGMCELSVEAYYKEMSNLTMLKPGVDFGAIYSNWEYLVEKNGLGKSKGVELFLNKTRGRSTGFISYTLSRTTRQFENINNGEEFLYRFDKTHSFNIVFTYNLKDNVNLSANWVFASGSPISIPTDVIYTPENEPAFIYDGINNYRMKDYHRLDLGINFIKSTKWGEKTLSFSIYNVYNRQNPYFYFMDFNYEQSRYLLKQQSLFPFMPAVSYSINFNKVSIAEGIEQYKTTKAEWLSNSSRNNIGLQFNKWMGYGDGWNIYVFAARYGYGIKKYLRVGAEFSGFVRERMRNEIQINPNLNFGVFARGKICKLKYLHPFVETSFYYSYNYFVREDEPDYIEHKYISGYIAPGVTLNLAKGGLNFDIFYKFSPHEMIDGRKSVITWRICLNF